MCILLKKGTKLFFAVLSILRKYKLKKIIVKYSTQTNMQYFTQDENFEMMFLTEDRDTIHAIENLNLPWEEHSDVMEQAILKYRKDHRLTLTRHTHVTETFTPKRKKDTPAEHNYQTMVGNFFADYLNNYVERLDAKYDQLITAVRKLLKVRSNKYTSKKHLSVQGDRFHLTCLDITRNKAKWRRQEYNMTLRYFEFINHKVDDCGNCCDNAANCNPADCGDCNDCTDCGCEVPPPAPPAPVVLPPVEVNEGDVALLTEQDA